MDDHLPLKIAIENVPIKDGFFPYVSLPEGKSH